MARQEVLVAQLNAAIAIDDRNAELQARRELWQLHRDVSTALSFVEAAIRAGELSATARTALDSALETLRADPRTEARTELATALDLQARCHVSSGQLSKAVDSYGEAVRVGGPSFLRLHQLGTLGAIEGRWEEAIPAVAALIANPQTPSHVRPHQVFLLASAVERSGRTYDVDALIAAYTPGSPASDLVTRPDFIAAVPVPDVEEPPPAGVSPASGRQEPGE